MLASLKNGIQLTERSIVGCTAVISGVSLAKDGLAKTIFRHIITVQSGACNCCVRAFS